MEDYDSIIQQQLEEDVVEEAEEPAQVKEFYIPHKAVIRESSETTKMRIVYDPSTRAYDAAPSLNECLESGPPLQNQLWKVLIRGHFHAVAIARDIQKAFLQVRIRAKDRGAVLLGASLVWRIGAFGCLLLHNFFFSYSSVSLFHFIICL